MADLEEAYRVEEGIVLGDNTQDGPAIFPEGIEGSEKMNFQDTEVPNVTLKQLTDGASAGQVAIFSFPLTHNGAINNGTYYGYNENVNGLDSPIPVPVDAVLKVFTFTNKRANADYDIVFRKNDPNGIPFLTISKTNVKNFTYSQADDPAIEESFNGGDLIYIQHIDTGTSPTDIGILLSFKAT